MSDDKTCPLNLIAAILEDASPGSVKCDEEKCAWWVKRDGRCAVASIPDALWAIVDHLPERLKP